MPLVKASLMVRIGQFVIDMILAKKRDQLEEEGRERWSLLCFIVALLLMLVPRMRWVIIISIIFRYSDMFPQSLSHTQVGRLSAMTKSTVNQSRPGRCFLGLVLLGSLPGVDPAIVSYYSVLFVVLLYLPVSGQGLAHWGPCQPHHDDAKHRRNEWPLRVRQPTGQPTGRVHCGIHWWCVGAWCLVLGGGKMRV